MWFFPPGSRRRLCRLTCPPPAANSSSRFALRQRAFAALRSPASHLLLAPLLPQRSSFTSAPRRIPRLLCRAEMSRGIHFMDIFPTAANMVGVLGFEPRTSSLSGTRSNQLSYTPSPQKVACLSATGLRPPLRGTTTFRGPRSPAFRAASPYSCLRVRIFVWSHPSLSDAIKNWWSRRDSNPQHPACKAGALAIELRPLAQKSCLPFGHEPQAPASRDRYFSGAPLSGIPCGFAVLVPASLEPFLRNIRSSAF